MSVRQPLGRLGDPRPAPEVLLESDNILLGVGLPGGDSFNLAFKCLGARVPSELPDDACKSPLGGTVIFDLLQEGGGPAE